MVCQLVCLGVRHPTGAHEKIYIIVRESQEFSLPFESCLEMIDFTYNNMVLCLTTIDMSGHTWMTLYLDRSKRCY
jgi:hypothetical protein